MNRKVVASTAAAAALAPAGGPPPGRPNRFHAVGEAVAVALLLVGLWWDSPTPPWRRRGGNGPAGTPGGPS